MAEEPSPTDAVMAAASLAEAAAPLASAPIETEETEEVDMLSALAEPRAEEPEAEAVEPPYMGLTAVDPPVVLDMSTTGGAAQFVSRKKKTGLGFFLHCEDLGRLRVDLNPLRTLKR